MSASSVPASILLDGFGRLIHFLLESEADCLCGVTLYGRSQQRVNYRSGYYNRKLRTHLGDVPLRVVHLKYVHPRVSILKRARRLNTPVLELLSQIHSIGPTPDLTAALIKTLWTLDLPPALLAGLTVQLAPILHAWCAASAINPVANAETHLTNSLIPNPNPTAAESPCAAI